MIKRNHLYRLVSAMILTTIFSLTGCTIIDKKVDVVQPFDASRYLGKWYEIARLDHSFERGLDHVTAEYKQDDDAIRVTNRGYDPEDKQWQSANGIAYFTDGNTTGRLKVSFFRPFYGAYQIHAIIPEQPRGDEQYQVSLVIGPDESYMWILARTPTINDATKQDLVAKAAALGINPADIIWVDQTSATESPSVD